MKRRRLRLFIIILAICFTFIVTGILTYKPILYLVEDVLIASDNPTPSDVIIILSGTDMKERVTYGVELYKQNFATTIIMSGGPRYWNSTAAADMNEHAIFLGVPPESILLEETSQTTYENAQYCLEIMQNHHLKSAIVVTSPFHTKRTKIMFEKLSKEKGISFTICAFEEELSQPKEWWKDEIMTRNIANEYLKLLWYCFSTK